MFALTGQDELDDYLKKRPSVISHSNKPNCTIGECKMSTEHSMEAKTRSCSSPLCNRNNAGDEDEDEESAVCSFKYKILHCDSMAERWFVYHSGEHGASESGEL